MVQEDLTTINKVVILNKDTNNKEVINKVDMVVLHNKVVIINKDLLKVDITNSNNPFMFNNNLKEIIIMIVAWPVLLLCVSVVLLMLFSRGTIINPMVMISFFIY